MKRREVLHACGVASIAGLAGCGARDPTTVADDGGADAMTTTAPPPTLSGTSIEAGEASCGTGTDEASVTFDASATAVRIDGTTSASNPCHRPVIKSVSYDGAADRLSVTIDVASTAETNDVCMMCLGALPYTVTATFDGRLPGRVVASHTGVSSPVADVAPEDS